MAITKAEPLAEPKLTLDELLKDLRLTTEEELTEQGRNLAANYKPGPRQAVPFAPKLAEPKLEELPALDVNAKEIRLGIDKYGQFEMAATDFSILKCRERQLLLLQAELSHAHELYKATFSMLVALRGERDRLIADLGQCYILSGADPDIDEDEPWRLAPYAVREVNRLREESDEADATLLKLEAQLAGTWFAHKEYIAAEVRNHCDESPDEIASFICFMDRPPSTLPSPAAPTEEVESLRGEHLKQIKVYAGWISHALGLPDDAPMRFDFYAEKIFSLRGERDSILNLLNELNMKFMTLSSPAAQEGK